MDTDFINEIKEEFGSDAEIQELIVKLDTTQADHENVEEKWQHEKKFKNNRSYICNLRNEIQILQKH